MKAFFGMFVCMLSLGVMFMDTFLQLRQAGWSDGKALMWCIAFLLPIVYVISSWMTMVADKEQAKPVPPTPKRQKPQPQQPDLNQVVKIEPAAQRWIM